MSCPAARKANRGIVRAWDMACYARVDVPCEAAEVAALHHTVAWAAAPCLRGIGAKLLRGLGLHIQIFDLAPMEVAGRFAAKSHWSSMPVSRVAGYCVPTWAVQ